MYYPDLTSYEYIPDSNTTSLHLLNVGWLDAIHPFPKGETTTIFQERLFEFCLHPVFKTRGVHVCELCGFFGMAKRGNKEAWLGSAEIRVIGKEGRVYVAPTLVYHYVVDHGYCPPEEFLQAVLESPLPNSPEYERFKQQMVWEDP